MSWIVQDGRWVHVFLWGEATDGLGRDASAYDKGAAIMAFTDVEIAEAHEAVRTVGDCENLYKLGLIYSTGQGVDIDYIQAHMWFNLAASRGSYAAKECRQDIAAFMSKNEIALAQRSAREWLSIRRH